MVIPWLSLTTRHGAILGATLRDGAIFAQCCAGQSAPWNHHAALCPTCTAQK